MSIMSESRTSVIADLVTQTGRDVERYESAFDPNSGAAGQAALRNVNAALLMLQEIRAELLREIHGAGTLGLVAGNSGPGLPTPRE